MTWSLVVRSCSGDVARRAELLHGQPAMGMLTVEMSPEVRAGVGCTTLDAHKVGTFGPDASDRDLSHRDEPEHHDHVQPSGERHHDHDHESVRGLMAKALVRGFCLNLCVI